MPGIGVSANYFERLAFQLNEFGLVIALDLPGFGGVPHPRRPRLTITEYAQPDDNVIQRAPHDVAREPSGSPADAAKALKGRATELAGIVTDDDATIARRRTTHAEAAESAARDER